MLRKIIASDDGVRDISLDSCPFCGKDVADFANCQELEACEGFEQCPNKSHYFSVVCSFRNGGCGTSSGFYPTRKEAAAAWNRRTGCLSLDMVKEAIERSTVGPAIEGRYE